jgi:hypothetical protein
LETRYFSCNYDHYLDGVAFGTETLSILEESTHSRWTQFSATTPDDNHAKCEEWHEKDKLVYNQIFLNISSIIQPLWDSTPHSHEAWKILLNYFAKNASVNVNYSCSLWEPYLPRRNAYANIHCQVIQSLKSIENCWTNQFLLPPMQIGCWWISLTLKNGLYSQWLFETLHPIPQ